VGIDVGAPRLSWKLSGKGRNLSQKAYSIRVSAQPSFGKGSLLWETGRIESDQSVLIPYQGPLTSSTRYYWQVKVWDQNNKSTAWSAASFFETGLLDSNEWKGQWIEPDQDTAQIMPALHLRKEFSLSKKVIRARAYVTSHGFYELYLNGKRVGDQVLTPGWTSYNKRLQYQVYDITAHLRQGTNAAGAILGDGWYRSTLGWVGRFGIYGTRLGLLAQIMITYDDGTVQWILTDDSWKGTQTGPIIANSIYGGETYDARKELIGWSEPGYDDSGWRAARVVEHDKTHLLAEESVPIRRVEELRPLKIFRTPKGTLVADMGQNMVGWIRLRATGKAGTVITIRHAEVLDKFGEFYTANLRHAEATARYILKGVGTEVYEPRFTFFGFRYVAIDGFPGELTPDDITGVVVHSDMTPTGTFSCSEPLINQLQHNIQWGQKGNFVDVPTDCPQRDERLGWTGDAQAFCRTAAFNMNVAPFFTKWLKDVTADQHTDGRVPWVIPDVLLPQYPTSAGWGDVAIIAPWTLYRVYGDKRLLETQYTSMKAYVDFIRKTAGDSYLWKGGSIFGDWLYYKPEMENHTEPDGHTNPDMIATMFFAYSAKLLAQTAAVLNKPDDEALYNGVFEKVRAAFQQHYVTPSGRIASDSQTAYVLALHFDLLPESLRPKATEYLIEDIRRRNTHLSTGFLGTPYLCHVLSSNHRTEVGYDLLLQKTFPSWLYPVTRGATTIWERWDGQKVDSTFQDVGMNSFNHYAYGAVGDWMYGVVAGIEIGKPGYKHILIQPQPDARLSFVNASYESAHGKILSSWKLKENHFSLDLVIPVNTTATIRLPHAQIQSVLESGKPLSQAKQEGNDVIVQTGSGEYHFTYPVQTGTN
jgi:alpha-L-rhamnosidase